MVNSADIKNAIREHVAPETIAQMSDPVLGWAFDHASSTKQELTFCAMHIFSDLGVRSRTSMRTRRRAHMSRMAANAPCSCSYVSCTHA